MAAYQAAIRERPSDPARHYLLGLCLLELGRIADGRQAMKRVISLAPRHGPAHFALGKAAMQDGDMAAAERHLRTALRCDPDLVPAYVELGNLFVTQHRADEALEVLRRALERKQDHAGLQANYGNVLYRLGNRPAAVEAWRAALKLDPEMATAHASLGLALRALGQWDEATAVLERAVALEPQVPEHRFNLALTYFQRRRYRDAQEALLAAEPRMREPRRVRVQRVRACQAMCDWDGLDALMPDVCAEVDAAKAGAACYLTPFASLSLPLDQASRAAVARRHAAEIVTNAQRLRPAGPLAPPAARAQGDRIHIGYLSSDFRDHPMAHLIAGMFALHDRARFEVSAFAIGPDDGSPWRRRIEAGADRLIDLQIVGDVAAAERIRAEAIDLLIDLNGPTAHARQEILALRPAPVQATWLGTPGTSGAPFHDYVLTDRIVTPPEMQTHYQERFCYLPGCYYPYDRETEIALDTATRESESLPDDAVVLVCFCAHYKIDRESFRSWCTTLAQVPETVLWLLGESPEGEANLRAAARAAGIDPVRLVFARRKPRAEHMARLALADLGLDTFIYGGHTTAADLLRAGVPMVTRLGPDFATRVGASLLTSLGMPALIAPGIAACAELATALAADTGRLAACRSELQARGPAAAIFDTPRLVRGMERAYDAMVTNWRAGMSPAQIDLSEPPYSA